VSPPPRTFLSRIRAALRGRLWTALGSGSLLLLVALLVWARQAVPADPAAALALDADETLRVWRDGWIALAPRDPQPSAGVIFYPGGRADPVAYGPMLRALAAEGVLVVLVPMPLNLALLAPDRAERIPDRFPEIRHWFMAGHSLGGSIAADYAARHRGQLAGLILWAAYPGANVRLADDLPVLSVFGTADELTTPGDIMATRERLAAGTEFVPVPGAGHWQFGNFALSGVADPGRAAHQAAIIAATRDFINRRLPGDARLDSG
jgi:hypothetical protein